MVARKKTKGGRFYRYGRPLDKIRDSSMQFLETPFKVVHLLGWEEYDLALVKFMDRGGKGQGWRVIEGKTGMAVCSLESTAKKAERCALIKLNENGKERFDQCVKDGITTHGLSPRYNGLNDSGVGFGF